MHNEEEIVFSNIFPTCVCGDCTSFIIDCNRELYSFGNNSNYKLGHNETNNVLVPKKLLNINFIKMISCGYNHTCFINYDGELFTFGGNSNGQLGIGKKSSFKCFEPQKVSLPLIEQISSGSSFNLCVTSNKELYVFGANNYGQLGIGSKKDRTLPILNTKISDIDFVECGSYFTICKTLSNSIYQWGYSDYTGGPGMTSTKPDLLKNLPINIISIKCGVYHALLLTTTGYVYSYGFNNHGQLGNTSIISSTYTPTLITSLPLIKRIECGYNHSICIDEDHNMWFFGLNSGQLGANIPPKVTKPTQHDSLPKIVDVSHGGNHTFVKTFDNEIFAFGNNNSSQLGILRKDSIKIPTRVFENNDEIWCTSTIKSRAKSARK